MKCYLKTVKTQTKQPQSHRNLETHLQKKKKKKLKRWTWRHRRQSKHILRYKYYKIFMPLKPK